MKLAPSTIYIVGGSLTLAIVCFGLFMVKTPNDAESALYETNLAELESEAGQQGRAQKRLDEAVALVNSRAATWRGIVATRTPTNSVNTGGINLAVNAWQLSVDTRKFRNSVQRAVNAQLRRGGVTVVNGPLVPLINENEAASSLLTSYYNYPPLKFPVVIFNLGTVTVQGTYKQITDHVRAFATMPRYLAVADGLQITGTSPNLTGTYNLMVVGFIRSRTIAPPVREGQASAAAGGSPFGGGIPGGPPGGIPGGPPGGIPGRPGGNGPASIGGGGR